MRPGLGLTCGFCVHTPRCGGEAISAFIRDMNWYAALLVVAGVAIAAFSVAVERREGAGRAGNVLLAGGSIAAVGLVWAFW